MTKINRRALLTLGGLAVAGFFAAVVPSHGIGSPNATTPLTFNKPIALPGVTLGAGTYIFERPAPTSAFDIVRVSSKDRRFVYYTGYTELVARPAGKVPKVKFGEVPAGHAATIQVWYPDDGSAGHRFIYR